ncbi:hypothetical protein GOP47_0027651 [Adiantum capillus-veneris]|nr:hypothetical protein GOP47_0027651 [Adiantum capillus-veneris]
MATSSSTNTQRCRLYLVVIIIVLCMAATTPHHCTAAPHAPHLSISGERIRRRSISIHDYNRMIGKVFVRQSIGVRALADAGVDGPDGTKCCK